MSHETPLDKAYAILKAHYHDFLIVANEHNEPANGGQVEDPVVVWHGGVAHAFRNLELARERVKYMRRSNCPPK